MNTDPSSLARLLGVDADLDPDRLRAAYDQEMSRATRAGDHRRALALSQAFDALPSRTRSSVYSGGQVYPTVLPPDEPRRRQPRRVTRSKSGRPRRRVSFKGVLGYGILVPGIVALVVWAVVRQNSGEDYAPPPVDDRSAEIVQHPQGPPLTIPATSPVGANGLAKVLCQETEGEPAYVLMAPPGTVVTCENGAAPVVVVP